MIHPSPLARTLPVLGALATLFLLTPPAHAGG